MPNYDAISYKDIAAPPLQEMFPDAIRAEVEFLGLCLRYEKRLAAG
jgi:hypothetical protein